VSVVISSLVPLKSRLTEGNGLKGMRERIENEGGEMRVLAKPASEMQCFLSLPLSLAVN
jgi:signal transduction histidine kinase